VVSAPYADPRDKSGKLYVVDLKAGKPVAKSVTLAQVRAEPLFQDLALVRQPRLSVVAVGEVQWNRLLTLSGKV
jgi:predicted RNA-binding protein with PUA-like domain